MKLTKIYLHMRIMQSIVYEIYKNLFMHGIRTSIHKRDKWFC